LDKLFTIKFDAHLPELHRKITAPNVTGPAELHLFRKCGLGDPRRLARDFKCDRRWPISRDFFVSSCIYINIFADEILFSCFFGCHRMSMQYYQCTM
jgi:hypothetical protein